VEDSFPEPLASDFGDKPGGFPADLPVGRSARPSSRRVSDGSTSAGRNDHELRERQAARLEGELSERVKWGFDERKPCLPVAQADAYLAL